MPGLTPEDIEFINAALASSGVQLGSSRYGRVPSPPGDGEYGAAPPDEEPNIYDRAPLLPSRRRPDGTIEYTPGPRPVQLPAEASQSGSEYSSVGLLVNARRADAGSPYEVAHDARRVTSSSPYGVANDARRANASPVYGVADDARPNRSAGSEYERFDEAIGAERANQSDVGGARVEGSGFSPSQVHEPGGGGVEAPADEDSSEEAEQESEEASAGGPGDEGGAEAEELEE